MLSVAAIGIQNIDKGQSTVSGLAIGQSLMDEARNLAVGRGTRARLCIHSDSSEEDRNLRYCVVAYEEIERDDSGEITGTSWRVDSRGTQLPSGSIFTRLIANKPHPRLTVWESMALTVRESNFPAMANPFANHPIITTNLMPKDSVPKKVKTTLARPSLFAEVSPVPMPANRK